MAGAPLGASARAGQAIGGAAAGRLRPMATLAGQRDGAGRHDQQQDGSGHCGRDGFRFLP
jgi:hypothetical protein